MTVEDTTLPAAWVSSVAMQLVQALESPNPRPRYRVTLPAALAWHLKRILPVRVADWFLRRVD